MIYHRRGSPLSLGLAGYQLRASVMVHKGMSRYTTSDQGMKSRRDKRRNLGFVLLPERFLHRRSKPPARLLLLMLLRTKASWSPLSASWTSVWTLVNITRTYACTARPLPAPTQYWFILIPKVQQLFSLVLCTTNVTASGDIPLHRSEYRCWHIDPVSWKFIS